MLIYQRPWTRQPISPARANLGNNAARGLKALAAPNNNVALATGKPLIHSATRAGQVAFDRGFAWDFTGSQWIDMGAMPAAATQASIFLLINPMTGIDSIALGTRDASSTEGIEFLLGRGSTPGLLTARYQSTAESDQSLDAVGLNDGCFHGCLASWDVSSGKFIFVVDGALVSSSVVSGGTMTPTQNLFIANRAGVLFATCRVGAAAFFTRGFDIAQAKALTTPTAYWQLFAPLPRRPWAPSAAAGGFFARPYYDMIGQSRLGS